MVFSTYHDDDSYGTENSTCTLTAPPPMSMFRSTLPERRYDEAPEEIKEDDVDDDDCGFTEGHFVDEHPQIPYEYDDHIDSFSQQQQSQSSSTTTRKQQIPTRTTSFWLLVVILLLGLITVTVILSLLLPDNSSDEVNSSSPNDTQIDTTNNISLTPSASPTATNETVFIPEPPHPQQQIYNFLDLVTQWSGEEALEDSSSSATKALQWLLFQDPFQWIQQPPNTTTISDWDVQQRYVAAVLYFALLLDDIPTSTIPFDDTLFLSGIDVCSWNNLNHEEQPIGGDIARGIFCNAGGNITELQFEGLGASGTIPMEISYLTHLTKINFAENLIVGSIPANVSNLKVLESIDIRNCSLTGVLPSELSTNVHLESLFLGNNALSGSIPPSWSEWTSLKHLDLAFNHLTGEVSPDLSNMTLEIVRLNGNDFSGSLDPAFCSENPVESLIADCLDIDKNVECSCCTFCCNEEGIECTSTALESSISDTIGDTTTVPSFADERLEQLHALLQPVSPDAFQDPNSIQSKVLQWMAFVDPNPPDLDSTDSANVIQRYVLILMYEEAGGVSWKDSNGWLKEPNVCDWDGISCDVDENLVTAIELGNHKLRGSLVSEIGILAQSLESLILSDNERLSGALPSEIGLLTSLTALDISNCKFSGPIPSEIGRLSNIVDFKVDNNLFSGPIPKEINGMVRAMSVSLGSNVFTGDIPSSIATIGTLKALKMNDCQFSGSIPPQITALDRLSTLDLSQNELSGGIPSAFGTMSSLENLYLDGNSGINGTVPNELAFLPRLKEFFAHGTAIIGNLDLLFCTGELEQVTANCLDPMVICTCCSICCDAKGGNCKEL